MSIMMVCVVLWLAVCAVYDLHRREAPNWLTLPAIALALVYRLLTPEGWLPWARAVVTVALTLTGILGGW